MKLGVMSALFAGRTLEQACLTCAEHGLQAIELPVGAYPGKPFFDPARVLASRRDQDRIRGVLSDHGLELSALAVHGNPVHPDRKIARAHHEAWEIAVALAPRLGTDIVITFSGCPGGSPRDTQPNWVTCPWPGDFLKVLEYQWDRVLVPYWSRAARLLAKHGVRSAWEPHPGFCVYNTDTLLRLSELAMKASGVKGRNRLGANLDPSHLFWQGIDPVLAARDIGEAGLLFHVHAKDTELDPHEGPRNGYLDTRHYGRLRERSWSFRACGWGHGTDFWRPFVSMLRRQGYDHVLSIEHEDGLMSAQEGFERSVEFLQGCLIEQPAAKPWWA
ncbi:MAG: sugar phosphate isomerase/epimerase [Planctomycetes bacterium]|nr:sugar phosphate isomerase/epimerase [Planctomycetota bacterium]